MGGVGWGRAYTGNTGAPRAMELAKLTGEVYCTMGDKNVFPDTPVFGLAISYDNNGRLRQNLRKI